MLINWLKHLKIMRNLKKLKNYLMLVLNKHKENISNISSHNNHNKEDKEEIIKDNLQIEECTQCHHLNSHKVEECHSQDHILHKDSHLWIE